MVSRSSVSVISARHFRNCQSLTSFEFSESGLLLGLEAVGLQFDPYRWQWRHCGLTWDSS